MNISGASFKFSSDDIKSIIEDFLEVPGLNITSLYIDKFIVLSGNFKKLVKIPFKLAVSIVHIKQESISFKLEKIEIIKLPIFNWVKNIALKKVVKTLKDYGISINGENVDMHITELLKKLPISIKFLLKSIELKKDLLSLEVEKVSLNLNSVNKTLLKLESGQASTEYALETKVAKKEDSYGKARKQIEEKSPDKLKGLLPYIMIMPDIIALFIRLFKDKRVPLKVKILCGSIITYLALPIDILPDFLPVIGQIDDVALAFYALDKILCSLPKEIIIDNWQGKEDIILFIRSGADYIYRVIGTSNIVKGYQWFRAAVKQKAAIESQVEVKEKETDGKEGLCD